MRFSRVSILSLLIVVGGGVTGSVFGDRVLAGTSRLSDHLRVYTSVLGAIEENYAEDVKTERLVSASIREMLRTLDPHSNFLETKEYGLLQERQKGSYYGLGITVQSVDGNITVVSPFEGTPAHRLGIRAGDVISRIEGEDARGMSIDDAVKRLRGPKGTPVRITVTRQDYETPLEFTVIRDEIPLHAVPYAFLVGNGKTAYVRLQDFNETTACRPTDGPDCERELERSIKSLLRQGATGVVLDIRDNPGGLLDQAFAVSNMFLRKGQLVVFTRGRSKRDEMSYVTETDSMFAGVPLVVLVSRHSASASEIVAGAIQDHDRGLIVGETTFGKGLVQTIMPLRNVRGYALALTTARYYTPSGRSIQRDYGSTALEDYVAPRDRKGCEYESGEARLTDAGRKVYGGNGITPDYCVEPPTPSKFVAHLVSRNAFIGFARGYAATGTTGGTEIAGAGSRSGPSNQKVKLIDRDFQVDEAVLADFRAYLQGRKLKVADEDYAANREIIVRLLTEEVLRQVFGEGEARRRSVQWDPQVRKAVDLMPRAEQLLKDPQRFIAERVAETRANGGARPGAQAERHPDE
ncbi:MAG TPA: S41 family peptidase [Vicinamibacteria bacterium]|nr:S41 family peptidase [Vicinamibacteria bacterium]